MFKHITRHLSDERGVETLEWIGVGALIVALAMAVYPGTLTAGINGVIADITAALSGVLT